MEFFANSVGEDENFMAEQSSRNVGWGIYDCSKKVPALSFPRESADCSPRGRRVEQVLQQLEEELFDQQDGVAEQLPDFICIPHNEFLYRQHVKQEEEDIAVCDCTCREDDPESTCGGRCLNMLSYIECTPGYCHCHEQCRNQRFQRCQYARLMLVKTDNLGLGLAADQFLKAGQFVIEYCGEVIRYDDMQMRATAYAAAGMKDSYIIELNGAEFIDATFRGSLARFINHSCEPNCETRKWTVLGEDRVGIFAKQDIYPGSELTFDYTAQWCGGSNVRCECGSPSCTGFVGTKFQKDTYTWEDNTLGDTMRKEAREQSSEFGSQFNVPLSIPSEKEPSTKNFNPAAATTPKTMQCVTNQACAPVRTGSSVQAEELGPRHSTLNRSLLETAKKSLAVRRRGPLSKKGHYLNAKEFGKFKQTTEPKVLRKETRWYRKPNALEEEERRINKKRARSDADTWARRQRVASAENILQQNLARVAAFQGARININKQLFRESINRNLVPESACAEVAAAQERETVAAKNLTSTAEELKPILKENQKLGPENLPAPIVDKWIEAHCRQLQSTFDFHFSIVRHLAGPTHALCTARDTPQSEKE